ncbi:hypothetical protein E2C01_029411 [Portunus trituberculatus]|uniref:Uncharacterized protein n=1 Tax=Portunus trituberculatus TaxID=210409 RepID=A0A5B7ENE1_PORTR|nr:hypothetical protein [Portunus trituberculatus]
MRALGSEGSPSARVRILSTVRVGVQLSLVCEGGLVCCSLLLLDWCWECWLGCCCLLVNYGHLLRNKVDLRGCLL